MTAPAIVLELVERFRKSASAYHSTSYNETQTRQEFIDPLFEALGWDIGNRDGTAEAYKDVLLEYSLKIGGATKAPDYLFRTGGAPKFFVEAKRPSRNLKEDAGPAFQLRRYAWSANLPLSIVTDFEELAVYDCRVVPSKTDKAVIARDRYISYTEYPDRWDEIAALFSRDAVAAGALDAYIESAKVPKGAAAVDTAFLKEIESWRESLATNIAAWNDDLAQRELNFAVQQTIDRIIFLRICEDRGIEPYGRLQDLLSGGDIYSRLLNVFRQADDRYNSGLFHFQEERHRTESPDKLTPRLYIEDKPLAEIIKNLYYPDSPYEFSVLPVEILGQVYEQFLGKVINLGSNRRVVVEDKPEVRKAGGVYYTPTYIVDYIVKHTVGTLLEGKTPTQATELRFLDPACGSGSFLIGAYQYLLDWHRDWYVAHGSQAQQKLLYQGVAGEWRLITSERKRILINNIYGVDIDSQAVEVTKLALSLKVLEGETEQSIGTTMRMFRERALPDLGNNIKCGNSLIAPDFYDDVSLRSTHNEERYQFNVFDWATEFPSILESGGFDAVIGNPPYLNIDDTWGKGDVRQRYLKKAYAEVYNDKTDILFYFLNQAVKLSKTSVCFIVSRAFLEAYKANNLRGWLAGNMDVQEIIDFRNFRVFPKAGITTAILSLTKKTKSKRKKASAKAAQIFQFTGSKFAAADIDGRKFDASIFRHIQASQDQFKSESWVFVKSGLTNIINKIDSSGEKLGGVLVIGQGMQSGDNNVFGKLSMEHIQQWGLEDGLFYKRARNSDIGRFTIRDSGELILYVEEVENFEDLPTGVQAYLMEHSAQLKQRAAYQRGNCDWWRYTWPLHKEYFLRERLYCPYMAMRNRFALDKGKKFLGLTDTTVLYDAGQPESLQYILGLLNSRLLTLRFQSIGKLRSSFILEYFWNSISKLPIRRINFSDNADVARHNQMVELVEQIQTLYNELSLSRTSYQSAVIQRQVDATDRRIDRLTYELYGLTAEEIMTVEGEIADKVRSQ